MTKRYLNRDVPGPTGEPFDYKVDDTDEGPIKIAISRDGPIIRIEFGKPVAWLGMTPADAVALARILIKQAGIP